MDIPKRAVGMAMRLENWSRWNPTRDRFHRSECRSKPAVLFGMPFMPHTPHTPPDRLLKSTLRKEFRSELQSTTRCEWFDDLYSLLNHIDQSGIKENTLIIYVCDNGWIQTEKEATLSVQNEVPMSTVPALPSCSDGRNDPSGGSS